MIPLKVFNASIAKSNHMKIGAGEMALWVKCLLHTSEDLSLDIQNTNKSWAWK